MKLSQLIRPYRMALLIAVILTSLESLSVLLLPWLGGQLLSSVFSSTALSLDDVFILSIIAMLAYLGFKLISYLWLVAIFEKILADLKLKVFSQVQALPMSFHNRTMAGDLLSLVINEVTQLSNFMTTTLVSFLPMLFTLVGAGILLLYIDATLALLVLLLLPIALIVIKLFARKIRFLGREHQRLYSKNVAIASENISLIRLIKHFAKEPEELSRFEASVAELRQISIRSEHVESYLDTSIQVLAFSAVLGLLWFASERLSVAEMDTSEAFSFLLYAALLTRPLSGLMRVFGQWQSAKGNLMRLSDVMGQDTEIAAQSIGVDLCRGDIKFEDLHFSYEPSREVLNGINATIREGEVVAIVGENGAGKTTLFHLLVRFYELKAGAIKIGGVDISDINLASLRKGIGVVSQHTELKNGTLRENLLYGLSSSLSAEESIAHESKVAELLDAVQLTQFIKSLPQGLETQVGENGIQLSGGQRQKVALARTLLANPRILLLDEATSMFDEEAEQAFIQSCRKTFAETTVLINSHRPSLLALADRTLHLQGGKLH